VSEILSLVAARRKPVIGTVQLGAMPAGSRYRGGTIGPLVDAATDPEFQPDRNSPGSGNLLSTHHTSSDNAR